MFKKLTFRKRTERAEDMATLRLLRMMVEENDANLLYNRITEQEHAKVLREVMGKVIMLEEKYK